MEEMVTIPKSEYEMLKELPARLAALERELSLLKNGRNSRTSSTPPSQDIGKSNGISLRPKSSKQSGGQEGHKGHTLLMKEDPDQVVIHSTAYCKGCGAYLGEVLSCEISRRQEIELPVYHPVYIEHQSHVKICPCCGKKNAGDYPCHIQAPVQYGSSVQSIVSYLSVYQYIPYQRIKRLLRDLFNLPISEGSIDNLLGRMSAKVESAYQEIQKHLSVSEVVGSDETGCRAGGKKHWFHVWQDKLHTFIVSHASRGYKVIAERFPKGFEQSIHVSDCWAAQLKTVAKRHQLCIAHLLRELLNFEKSVHSVWSAKMKDLFYRAMALKHTLGEEDYHTLPTQVIALEKELDELLAVDYTTFHVKEQALIQRLIKNRNSILTFLYYKDVPPDNNASERAIRNVKVKTKVSGQFRNEEGKGADRFARIRSIIDTTLKNGQDVYPALRCLANS